MKEMEMNDMDSDSNVLFAGKPAAYDVCVSCHPGLVRSQNEDNFVINDVVRNSSQPLVNLNGEAVTQPLVCGVFDGMGGEVNGELASELCAKRSVGVYRDLKNHIQLYDAVFRFVTDSNRAVVEMLDDFKSSRGGSTFVLAALIDDLVYPFSLGDSRLYLFSDGVLNQITADHTLAMKKYLANIYTLEEAVNSPDSHKLTRFLGMDCDQEGLTPEIYAPFRLREGEKLLLCSDGLYDMCSDREIAAILHHEDSNTVSYNLVKASLERGGVDNITCMVIKRTIPQK